MNTRIYEWNDETHSREYRFAGLGIDAQPIFAEYETRFTIADGVTALAEFIGYVTSDYRAYVGMIR